MRPRQLRRLGGMAELLFTRVACGVSSVRHAPRAGCAVAYAAHMRGSDMLELLQQPRTVVDSLAVRCVADTYAARPIDIRDCLPGKEGYQLLWR